MLKYLWSAAIILSGTVISAQVPPQNIQTDFLDTLTLMEVQQRIHACYYQGDNQKGLEFSKIYKQRIAGAPLDSQKVHIVASYNLMALFYNNLGQKDEALNHYREARDIAREVLGESHVEYIIQVGAIGLLYKQMALFEKALPYQEEAYNFRLQESPMDTSGYLTTAKNYAILLHSLDRKDECYEIWDDIMPLSRAYGAMSMNHAGTLYNAAAMLEQDDKWQESTPLYRESAHIVMELTNGEHPAYGRILDRLSRCLFNEGKIDSAIIIAQTSVELVKRKYAPGDDLIYYALVQLASYYEFAENIEESTIAWLEASRQVNIRTENLSTGLNEIEQVGLLDDVSYIFNYIQSYALRHPNQSSIIKAVYNNQLYYKKLLLSNKKQLIARLAKNADEELREKLQDWQELSEVVGRQLSLPKNNQDPGLDSMVMRMEEMESILAHQSKEFNQQRRYVTWKDVQTSLGYGELALEFSVFRYCTPEGIQDEYFNVVYSIDNESLMPKMTVLFKQNEAPNLNATRQIYRYNPADSTTLNKLVYEPLSEVLAGKTKVFYAPDGLFHRINLQAIPVDANGTMQDYFEMQRLSSTALVLQDEETSEILPKSALVFGGIDYGSDEQERASNAEESEGQKEENISMADSWRALGGSDWGYLSWTKTEAQRISTMMTEHNIDVTLKMDQTASEEIFKETVNRISEPAVLHLATHGYFFPSGQESEDLGFSGADNPLIRSGLILAGGNFAWTGGIVGPEEEDQILTAYEIAQLDLEDIELVVLSACDTGLGDVKNGEGVYGLQRAFKLAGARYVMMSLFEVPDKQTKEFMELFYGEWMINKKEIPQAFQSAQKQLRNRYEKPFNPSLWAGFILME